MPHPLLLTEHSVRQRFMMRTPVYYDDCTDVLNASTYFYDDDNDEDSFFSNMSASSFNYDECIHSSNIPPQRFGTCTKPAYPNSGKQSGKQYTPNPVSVRTRIGGRIGFD